MFITDSTPEAPRIDEPSAAGMSAAPSVAKPGRLPTISCPTAPCALPATSPAAGTAASMSTPFKKFS